MGNGGRVVSKRPGRPRQLPPARISVHGSAHTGRAARASRHSPSTMVLPFRGPKRVGHATAWSKEGRWYSSSALGWPLRLWERAFYARRSALLRRGSLAGALFLNSPPLAAAAAWLPLPLARCRRFISAGLTWSARRPRLVRAPAGCQRCLYLSRASFCRGACSPQPPCIPSSCSPVPAAGRPRAFRVRPLVSGGASPLSEWHGCRGGCAAHGSLGGRALPGCGHAVGGGLHVRRRTRRAAGCGPASGSAGAAQPGGAGRVPAARRHGSPCSHPRRHCIGGAGADAGVLATCN